MRSKTSWVIGEAAVLLIGMLVVPAASAHASVTVTDTAPATALATALTPVSTPSTDPYSRTVLGDYGYTPSAPEPLVPTSTTTLRFELPPQAVALGITTYSYSVSGGPGNPRSHGLITVAAGATSIDAPLKSGSLDGPNLDPLIDASGNPYYTFHISATADYRGRVGAPPQSKIQSTGPLSGTIELKGSFRPVPPDAGTAAATTVLSLDPAKADTFTSSNTYWIDSPVPAWLSPGSQFTVMVPASGSDGGSTARVESGNIWSDPPTPVPAEPGTPTGNGLVPVSVSIPTDFDVSAALGGSGSVVLGVAVRNGIDESVVRLPAMIGSAPTVATPVSVSRIAGQDRFMGAYEISKALVPHPIDTIYLASGQIFADALSVAPLAAMQGRPVALGTADQSQLNHAIDYVDVTGTGAGASQLVEIGGDASLPYIWYWALTQGQGARFFTEKIEGADRFEVSRNIASYGWGATGAPTVFIATGRSFADALSSVPAAASQKAPVVLVDGSSGTIGDATRALLAQLGTRRAVIVGGPESVSPAIEGELRALLPGASVTRFGGADRYSVSQAINAAYFPRAGAAYLASGQAFADALPGGVLAGAQGAPLYLAHADCVPGGVLDSMAASHVTQVTLLGGSATLTSAVQELRRCG